MKPKILLLLNNRLLRLEIKKKLDEIAEVHAGVSLEDLIPEIKWTEIGAVLIDMTDSEMDGYGMLEVLNTTYPSVPVVCLVNNKADAEEYRNQSSNNSVFQNDFEAGAIADKILEAISGSRAGAESASSGSESSSSDGGEKVQTNNSRESFATQMLRLQGNIRRVDDYAWGEVTQVVKQEQIPWSEVEWLERFNIGLEGFLQIQIESRDGK